MAPTLVTKKRGAKGRPSAISKPLKSSLKQKEKKPASLLSRTLQLPTEAPDQDEDDGDGEGAHLHGFSTDEDSSDEESDLGGEPMELDIGKLPTISKDDETVKRKLEKAKRQPVRVFPPSFLSSPYADSGSNRQKIAVYFTLGDFHMGSMRTN